MLVILMVINIHSSGAIAYVSETYRSFRARATGGQSQVYMGQVGEGLGNQVREFEGGAVWGRGLELRFLLEDPWHPGARTVSWIEVSPGEKQPW